MSLKKKLLFLLLISCGILSITFWISFKVTLQPSLKEQKGIFLETQKERIKRAWSMEEEDIALLFDAWINQDNIARYIKNPSDEYINELFKNDHFSNGIIDFATIMTLDTKILFYKNYRPGKGFIDFKEVDIINDMNNIRRIIRSKLGFEKNLLKTPFGSIMIVAAPIFDRGHVTRMEGILVLGRYVDERMLKRISFTSMQDITALYLSPAELEHFAEVKMQGMDALDFEERNRIMVYLLMRDISNNPALVLHMESDNRIFSVIRRHTVTFIIFTVFLIVILGITLFFAIDKYIIKRMLSISERMRQIEGLEDLSIRIGNDNNNDEVSHLITNINLSLDRLEQEKINREKAENSMIQQGKLASIGRLTSSIAHEINNPLMAIGNSLQVIKKICRSLIEEEDSLLGEAVEISESEVERIRIIISALLDFHRMDKEELTLIHVNKTIEQSIAILNWSKKLAVIEIIKHMPEERFIMGSPVRLKQVFINFILNAAEAMGREGGKIIIETGASSDNQFVEIHFKDNGPGLSPEVKQSLFEPFVSTKEDKGVGLGLYISYKIIKNHQGEILYNEEYKDGAHFIIRLPVTQIKTS